MRKLVFALLGWGAAAVSLVPLYIALTVSLKRTSDLSSRWLLPGYLHLEHYTKALHESGLLRAAGNSLLLTACTAALIVIVGAMSAYPLARVRSRASRWITNLVLAVMMIPSLSIIVPLYSVMVGLDAINTYWGMILVLTTYNVPLAIFLYANFIRTIPRELDEAAMIDGYSIYSVFYRIILPQLKPVTAAVLIVKGLKVWNDYEFALYFLQRTEKHTVTLTIARFFSEFSSDINAASAAALLAVVPVTAAFLLLQKYFVAGLSDGAVKG
ncbi:carbohydrate ABC transporter permease [Paenibacillus sp. 1P07SE]|uniref:carbohydrate ABC transporter permease n=1 Tax=Paenibacillus sp. 1P07SE TaxID=3132209 RepID=UPI0039A60702